MTEVGKDSGLVYFRSGEGTADDPYLAPYAESITAVVSFAMKAAELDGKKYYISFNGLVFVVDKFGMSPDSSRTTNENYTKGFLFLKNNLEIVRL